MQRHCGEFCLASVSAVIFLGAPAQAADYWVLKATPSLKPQAAEMPAEPAIALSAGGLPDGMEGKAYSFDLKTLTQVTAGPGIGAVQYAPGGAGFTVVGTYVDKTGQQVYTIKVGESVLQAVQISLSRSSLAPVACAVTTSGAAKCWGRNGSGQLGKGTTTNSGVPVQAIGLTSGVTSVSVGASYACATVSGAAKCWGTNVQGQLGDGSKTPSTVPVQVVGLTAGVSSVATGALFACALVTGAVRRWGDNHVNQLGDGTTTSSQVPVQVAGLNSGVASLTTGGAHSCAVVLGAAKCWGYNGNGQLGDGTAGNASVPVQVANMT